MQMIGLARLGRDADVRYTQSGDAVCSLSLAFNYGRKGQDGSKPTQWVEGSLWGKQAEALAPHLTTGKMLCVTIDEPHIETYEGRNGTGHKLTGRISSIEFAGGGEGRRNQGAPSQSAPAAPPAQRPASTFDSIDEDIPF